MINLVTNKIFLLSVQGVGSGDSGAGLCFFPSDSYYLTGSLSVKDPDTNDSIATFTEIEWIRRLYNKHIYVKCNYGNVFNIIYSNIVI